MQRRNLTHRVEPVPNRGLDQARLLKDTEEALHQSQDRFRALVENLRDLVFTVNTQGTLLYASPASQELTGYTPEELMGHSFLEFVAAADRERMAGVLREAIDGREDKEEFRIKRKNGAVCWVRSNGRVYREHGEVVGLQGVLTDITAQRQAAAALERHSEELETCVDQRTAQLVAANRALKQSEEMARLRETVAAAANTAGNPDEALQATLEAVCLYRGWPCGLVWFPDPTTPDAIIPSQLWYMAEPQRCLELHSATMTTRFRRGECFPGRVLEEGIPMWLSDLDAEERCARCRDALQAGFHASIGLPVVVDGRVEAVLEFFSATVEPEDSELLMRLAQVGSQLARAIERQKINQALQQATKASGAANASKSLFLANMSHEIRTPLTAILGFSQLLARGSDLSKQQREYLRTIVAAGDHLLEIINDVLEVSKIEAGQAPVHANVFELDAFIADLRVLYGLRAEQKGLEFSIEIAPSTPHNIRTDRSKLRQVLVNLLSNAIKYTDQGRVILRLSGVREGGRVLLRGEVEDTGIGISEEFQAQIFGDFVQSCELERGGVGLGLSICQRQIELLHGDLAVQSLLGRGSVFSFAIPVEEIQSPESTAREKGSRKIGSGIHAPLDHSLLDRAAVARLPVELVQNLRQAAETGDAEAFERLCLEVTKIDARLAGLLAKLSQEFELEQLLALMAG